MSEQSAAVVESIVRQHCKTLHLPTLGSQSVRLATEAIKGKQSHMEYLEALLAAEVEERERRTVERRIREAHLPKVKTLEDFDFSQAPTISAAQIRDLAEGGYIDRAEPVVLTGDCGTGKTHLATALCVAACRQRRRARFTTATALVNEFVEARQDNRVSRLLSRWFRYELVAIDEVGYVPLADVGAEFLYQVVSERTERAALVITTNLGFSEWTQVFANARLCKAMVDRVTDRAHIIDTGKESYRFRRTLESRKRKSKTAGRDGSHE
ncbi:MAG: IS21-like element helper ATPase IstB [Acidobacteriia bacterium]|nr:IS21-like element helper ATPase IstB [Terriglobia bacterium]